MGCEMRDAGFGLRDAGFKGNLTYDYMHVGFR